MMEYTSETLGMFQILEYITIWRPDYIYASVRNKLELTLFQIHLILITPK